MSTKTTNLELIKPELTDSADITAFNSNWDKLDEHTHGANTLDGIMHIAKGGTGSTTAEGALQSLGAMPLIKRFEVAVPGGGESLSIEPNKFYVLRDYTGRNVPLVFKLVAPLDTSIVNEYRFRVTTSYNQSESIYCDNATIYGLPSALVSGNTYEISIIDGYATYTVWEGC